MLDRENSSEVDAYNKLLEKYHDAVFLGMTETDVKTNQTEDMKQDMDVFQKLFANKTFKSKKAAGKLEDESFTADIRDLKNRIENDRG